MAETHSLAPGSRLGRYELICPIASGGMAAVWAARLMGPRGFQKLVAVKVMHPALHEEPDAVRMFLAEAALASRIRHPNVVEVLDLGEEAESLYIVMEWIHGAPLSQVIGKAQAVGGVPPTVAVRIARHVAAGLHAAHTLAGEDGTPLGLVHRDISPHNILVGFNGVTKVVDFGIAKVTNETSTHTEFGAVKGKLAYMAPEQLRAEPLDSRTDVFALGTVLYLMSTGRHPFRRPGDQREAIHLILSDEKPELPSRLIEGYPPKLEAIVMRALEKERDARYPTAEAMEADLTRALPPSPREADVVRDFARSLLPKSYDEGIELARVAMNAFAPLSTASSFTDIAKPHSNSTLRAVSIPSGLSASQSNTGSGIANAAGAHETEPAPKEPRGRVARVALALALASAVGAVLVASVHGSADAPKRAPAASAGAVEPPPAPAPAMPPASPSAAATEGSPSATAVAPEATGAVPAPRPRAATAPSPKAAVPLPARPRANAAAPAPRKSAPPQKRLELKDPYQ